MEELDAMVDKVAADAAIKGAVVTSGKDTFGGGADLTMLEKQRDDLRGGLKSKGEEAANRWCSSSRAALADLSASSRPAASRGSRRSTAPRWAAASSWRSPAIIASPPTTRRRARPARDQGRLFPGAGGTQRIARMMATADALQFLLKGDQIRLDRAKTMKLGRQRRAGGRLVSAAKTWIKTSPKSKQPWDVDGFKLPGGPDLVEDGYDDMAGRERALTARRRRTITRGARDHVERVRGPAGAVRYGAAHRVAATSPRSSARRKPRR
jgi:3-hydroxyacyl-CoA dehydrogenase/enoyl-CoA hydratase/3-hydroxybutyryl-CoA epimerase